MTSSRLLSTLLAILRPEVNEGYGRHAIPSPRDAEITALLNAEGADSLARLVTEEHQRVLRVYAERMASFAVRANDRAALQRGLTALAMGGLASGSRDALTILSLFQDAAMRIGASAAELFGDVAREMGGTVEAALVEFQQRSEEDRAISAMGYQLGRDSDGVRYERTW